MYLERKVPKISVCSGTIGALSEAAGACPGKWPHPVRLYPADFKAVCPFCCGGGRRRLVDRQEIEQEAPRFSRGLLCFILGLAFGSPPAAACLPQGRIGCVSLRRGAQCAPARVGRPACIRFKNRHDVEAKSALPRNALAGIPCSLPCFSSPNGTRCRWAAVWGPPAAAPNLRRKKRRPTLWGPRKANENALLTPRPA